MKKLSGLIALIFLVGAVSAFEASVHRPDPSASPDDPALIQVQVNNTFSTERSFSIGVFSPKPSWVYTGEAQSLQPGEIGVFNITVTPGEYSVDNTYSMTIYVKASGTSESKQIPSSFRVDRARELILEDVNLVNDSYMPGDKVQGSAKVRSISSTVLRDYKIVSRYENFSTTKTSSPILPGGTRNLEFSLDVPEGKDPGRYTLNTSLYLRGEEISGTSRNFTVGEVEDIEVNESTRNNLLTYRGFYEVKNNGNAPENYTVERKVASYLAPITGFSRTPDSMERTGAEQIYRWNINLRPGEQFQVTRTTNYWMPAASLLGIIAALVALKKLRNTTKITKTVEKDPEGLKVSIEVENISDRTFKEVKVEDFVPDIAEVEKNFEMAAPTVRRTNDGTKLVWNLEDLEPGDQRILQYVIKPKVEVEGGAELQEAVLKENGEEIKRSNKVQTDFQP